MDSAAALRRLDAVARHLLPHQFPGQTLYPNHLSMPELSSGESSPVLIGGMVLDILAKPYTHPLPGTTTPGEIQYVSGGVARNIAECMSKIGTKPFMISVVGHDMAGDLLLRYWESAGISTQGILQLKNIATPVVLNIFDPCGELISGVANVEAVEKVLSPDKIKQFHHHICSAPMLILDANLCRETLEVACQIAAGVGIPVWFEPVSVTKSARIATVVDYISCASPNQQELIAMANALSPGKELKYANFEANKEYSQPLQSLYQTLKPAICLLLEKGVKLLVVTLGSNGAFVCYKYWPKYHLRTVTRKGIQLHKLLSDSHSSRKWAMVKTEQKLAEPYAYHFPTLDASVVSVTGAGDCLVGGVAAAICSGLDIMQSVAVGMAVAKAAVESEGNVPDEISLTHIAGEAKRILSGVQQLHLI